MHGQQMSQIRTQEFGSVTKPMVGAGGDTGAPGPFILLMAPLEPPMVFLSDEGNA